MKFIILNTDYLRFVENEYKNNINLNSLSYDKQLQSRYDSLFGIANFYSKNLIKLGHEAIDIFPNNHYLQKQWAKEHNVSYGKDIILQKFPKLWRIIKPDWYYKILEEQILSYKPDIIYSMGMESISSSFFRKIKRSLKSTRIIGQHAATITKAMNDLNAYDLILSSLPNQVEYFRSKGVKSEYFPLGFEATILDKLKKMEHSYDVTHIGGYGRIHNERNEILEAAAREVDIKFWGFGLNNLTPDSPIRKNFQGEAWGIEMYNILHNSRITLTKHITVVAGNYANNMTLYEATGSGAMLLTDWKENLSELFEIDKEVATYRTVAELVEKINYYLQHDDERQQIARAGQLRTLKDHTWEKRMADLIKIINKW